MLILQKKTKNYSVQATLPPFVIGGVFVLRHQFLISSFPHAPPQIQRSNRKLKTPIPLLGPGALPYLAIHNNSSSRSCTHPSPVTAVHLELITHSRPIWWCRWCLTESRSTTKGWSIHFALVQQNASKQNMIHNSAGYQWEMYGRIVFLILKQPSFRNAEEYLKSVVVSHVPQACQMRAKVSQYLNDSR